MRAGSEGRQRIVWHRPATENGNAVPAAVRTEVRYSM